MCMGGPSVPAAPPPPPPPPEVPKLVDEKVQKARDDERRRAVAMSGPRSTILTGASGLSGSASTTAKDLLGQ